MATSGRLDELKKKFDENPRRYFAPLANEYRKQGDLTQAIALCRTHLPNQPGHISGHIVLAQALYEARELPESRQYFEAALDLDPENLIALRYLGDIAREQGAISAARTWYERVLEADPRNEEIAGLLNGLDGLQDAPSVPDDLATRPTPAPYSDQADQSWQGANIVLDTSSLATQFAQQAEPAPATELLEHRELVIESAETTIEQVEEAPIEAMELPSMLVEENISTEAPSEPTRPQLPTPLGELAAIPEPSIEDWFAQPSAPHAAEPESSVSETPDFPEFTVEPPAVQSIPTDFTMAWEAEHVEEPAPVHNEEAFASAPFEGVELSSVQDAEPAVDPVASELASVEAVEMSQVEFDPPEVVDEAEPVVVNASGPVAEEEEELRFESASVELEIPEIPETSISADEFNFADTSAIPVDAFGDTHTPVSELGSAWENGAPEVMDIAEVEPRRLTPPWEAALAPEQLDVDAFVGEASTPEAHVASEPVTDEYDDEFSDADPILGRTPDLVRPTGEQPAVPFVTETMAELYVQQGFVDEAIAIYRQLLQQQPGDATLAARLAELESPNIPVAEDVAVVAEDVVQAEAEVRVDEAQVDADVHTEAQVPSEAPVAYEQTVRQYFAAFADRRPRRGSTSPGNGFSGSAATAVAEPEAPSSRIGGAAMNAEALTQPDENRETLADLFAARQAAAEDEAAAQGLAQAFSASPFEVGGERELSLERLFRDVPDGATGAVTSDAPSLSSVASDAGTSPGDAAVADRDIEQFTAWLEGLKKK